MSEKARITDQTKNARLRSWKNLFVLVLIRSAFVGMGCLLVLSVAALIAVQCEPFQSMILSKVRKVVRAKYGTEASCASFKVRILSGFSCEKLVAISQNQRHHLTFIADLMELNYHLSLFHPTITIEDFLIRNGSVQGELNAAKSEEAPVKDPSSESQSRAIVTVEKWLKAPLVAIRIKRAQLENLAVDLLVTRGGTRAQIKASKIDADLHLELIPENFEVSGHFAAAPDLLVTESPLSSLSNAASKSSPTLQTRFQANLAADLDGKLRIHKANGTWAYEIKPGIARFHLKNSKLPNENNNGRTRHNFPEMHLQSNLVIAGKFTEVGDSVELLSIARNSINELSGTTRFELSKFDSRELTALSALGLPVVHKTLQIEKLKLHLQAGLEKLPPDQTGAEPVQLSGLFSLERFQMLGITRQALSAGLNIGLISSRDLKKLRLSLDLQLQALRPFKVKADVETVSNHGSLKELNTKAEIAADFDPKLGEYLYLPVSLNQYGHPKLTAGLASRILFGSDPASNEPTGGTSILHRLPVAAEEHGSYLKIADYNMKLEAEALKLPGSKNPWTISFQSKGDWQKREGFLQSQTHMRLTNGDFGKWKITNQSDLQLSDSKKPSSSGNDKTYQSRGQTELVQETAMTSKRVPFDLRGLKPMRLTHNVRRDSRRTLAELNINLPHLVMNEVADVDATEFSFTADVPNERDQDLVFSADLHQGHINPSPAILKGNRLPVTINGLIAHLAGRVKDKTSFVIQSLEASINQSLLKLTGDAQGNLKTKDLQARAEFTVKVPRDFPAILDQTLRGAIHIPLKISSRGGKDVDVTGTVGLEGFEWRKGVVRVSGINGRIPFHESFHLNEYKSFRFSNLVTQNPFERVNYERLQPLLEDASQLTIERLSWEERQFGPLIGFVSIKQNMISLHEFNLDLVSGRVYGEMFFDAYPKNLQFGLLARLTGIDLVETLPKRFLLRLPSGEKKLSARTGLVFDLKKSTVDGRMDITQIGGPQLITMLNLLDPDFRDEKINRARSLLEIGYPTAVALSFQQGFVDLNLDLMALGLHHHESIRGVPISGIISSKTNQLMNPPKVSKE